MCNFVGIEVSKTQYVRLKQIEKELGLLVALKALQSGFEYNDWEIAVKANNKQEFDLIKAHWEFIPPWIKSTAELKEIRKKGIPWLNATAERLLESKMFRDAALKRRCLIPVSWFYEWRHFKPEGSKKDIAYPYLISLKDNELIYLAGIWQPWLDRETGELINTFAIVTTKANSLMEQIHNTKKRMPTILPLEFAEKWLFEELTEKEIMEIAAFQYESLQMKGETIRKDFRLLADPLEKFNFEELPAIS